MVERPVNPALEKRPEALDSVRVDIAIYIADAVTDGFVLEDMIGVRA